MTAIERFSERLVSLTKEKEMTPHALTKALHIPHSTAQAWFVGKSFPTVHYLIMLAGFFGCTTDYLLGITNSF